jgi:catechol 2,3-dioxygenase-like lactoylglutathione lyase family enzyme
MNIIGPDTLVFGVDDVEAASLFAQDYGLLRPSSAAQDGVFEALDGTSITIKRADDPDLPPAIAATPNIREIIYGCVDQASVDAVGAELQKDRAVRRDADGAIHAVDDDGYPIGFRVTRRRAIALQTVGLNSPGSAPGRPVNVIAADPAAGPRVCTLSHVVLFSKDIATAERFYVDRLHFRTTDMFQGVGPFLRPKANPEHHTLFLIGADRTGLEHFAFHVAGPSELLQSGYAFVGKGYKSAWGPGRHILGSNYFWYFNSPFGGKIEYDADMDTHDDAWEPRVLQPTPDSAQIYTFEPAAKYLPGPPRRTEAG